MSESFEFAYTRPSLDWYETEEQAAEAWNRRINNGG